MITIYIKDRTGEEVTLTGENLLPLVMDGNGLFVYGTDGALVAAYTDFIGFQCVTETTPAQAAQDLIPREEMVPAEEKKPPKTPAWPKTYEELRKWKLPELKDAASSLGLDAKGNKPEVVDAIATELWGPRADPPGEEPAYRVPPITEAESAQPVTGEPAQEGPPWEEGPPPPTEEEPAPASKNPWDFGS